MIVPMPIVLPPSNANGGDLTPLGFVIVLVVSLLMLQYAFLVILVMSEEYFKNKIHALTWLIPGWPILDFAYYFFARFKEL